MGFYEYEIDKKGKPVKKVNPAVYELIRPVVSKQVEVTDDDIKMRMMIPMITEASRCLEDQIVNSPVEVDMGLLLGLGHLDEDAIAEGLDGGDAERNSSHGLRRGLTRWVGAGSGGEEIPGGRHRLSTTALGRIGTHARRVPTYELEVPSRPGMGVRLTEPKPPLQRKNRVQALTAATQA
jgi:hypothetical protein